MDHDFLKIDPLNLDAEWVAQPRLYMMYAEKMATAQRERDEAKQQLDVVAADLNRFIRLELVAKAEKFTEAMVSTSVTVHERYLNAQKQLNDAQYEFNIYTGAVTALEHRKRALTMLVELHQSSYFAEPTAKSNGARDAMVSAPQRALAKRVNTDPATVRGERRQEDKH